MKQRIIDLHCDSVQVCRLKKQNLFNHDGHVNIEKLRSGGALAQCFALWIIGRNEIQTYRDHGYDIDIPEEPYELFHELIRFYKKSLIETKDYIAPAYCADDIIKNATLGKISSVLTIEDSGFLDGKTERIQEAFSEGVRLMTLTWNYENCLGYPNSPDPALHSKGLKKFGFEAIEMMNDLGIIIDVSHLSEGGFWDVKGHSEKPFVASHSCARNLVNHSRNLTDEQLKALADAGGVVGVNFCNSFLTDNPDFTGPSSIDDVIRNMAYMKNVCGAEAICWGGDFDGIDSALEFRDYSGYPLLLAAAEKVFTPDELDKVNSGNFLRVFEAQETKPWCGNCNFEWSSIHLGAGILDDYRSKQ